MGCINPVKSHLIIEKIFLRFTLLGRVMNFGWRFAEIDLGDLQGDSEAEISAWISPKK
jgi:hypothetical protein